MKKVRQQHPHKTLEGQLTPLQNRLSDDQLRARAAKTEVRRLISVEHAKTRGLVNLALNSAMQLHKRVRRFEWAAVVALLLILVHVAVFALKHFGVL